MSNGMQILRATKKLCKNLQNNVPCALYHHFLHDEPYVRQSKILREQQIAIEGMRSEMLKKAEVWRRQTRKPDIVDRFYESIKREMRKNEGEC